jgi:NAD(P)-dependent dehydrogenase (short-subunit alcohol dehydrogenase family)
VSGIGRASALALAKAGAQVLVHYSSSEEADAVVAEIRKTGGRAEKVGADLRQADGPHMSNFTKTEAGREVTVGMQALQRVAQPDDIGPAVAFLASDDARWITVRLAEFTARANSCGRKGQLTGSRTPMGLANATFRSGRS